MQTGFVAAPRTKKGRPRGVERTWEFVVAPRTKNLVLELKSYYDQNEPNDQMYDFLYKSMTQISKCALGVTQILAFLDTIMLV